MPSTIKKSSLGEEIQSALGPYFSYYFGLLLNEEMECTVSVIHLQFELLHLGIIFQQFSR